MNPRNGKFRVILVYLSFVPLALGVMWLVGGNIHHCEVSVESQNDASLLADRFATLPTTLSAGVLEEWDAQRASNVRPVSRNANDQQTNDQSLKSTANLSLNDLANKSVSGGFLSIHGHQTSLSRKHAKSKRFACIDPNVVRCDVGFDSTSLITRKWAGRSQCNVVMILETDKNSKSRLVQVDPSQIKFLVSGNKDQIDSVSEVTYCYQIHHTGFRRIYGRFLERSCEEMCQQRLAWICKKLGEKNTTLATQ